MSSIQFSENGLNVHYISDFIEKSDADRYLAELCTLPFYNPTLKIRGKEAKPKRQVLAFGDSNTSYAFSGTCIPAEPWTPLMIELRDRVEKHAACTFNFVLLNCYPDGSSFISPHKDNKSTTFPVMVLSFGAKRTLTFTRPNMQPTSIQLEHGSLYSMENPTNDLFKHGIARESTVKDMRISLTFHHLIPLLSPLKKMRHQVKQPLQDSSPKATEPTSEDDKNCSPLNESNETELTNIIHAEWDLSEKTFLQIVLKKNFKIRIHIRTFKKASNGDLVPSKMGVTMTPVTWYFLQGKLLNFKLQSEDDSFISNNQLLVASVCTEYCILQQMFPLNSLGFLLKPSVVKLTKDQISNLSLNYNITESIIEAKLSKVLPKLIFQISSPCTNHVSEEIAKENLVTAIALEVMSRANFLYECSGCTENRPLKINHECMMEHVILKFRSNRQLVYLSLNLSMIVQNLPNFCYCHYNNDFFDHFNILSNEALELENALEKLSHHTSDE